MAAIAAGVAAAAVAASAVATGVQQATAGKAAQSALNRPSRQIPLPGYATALNRETARAAALNMNKQPPSLDQYVRSGGTATFPWTDPGITAADAKHLGLVNKFGYPVPGMTSGQASQAQTQGLSAEQFLLLAQKTFQQGHKSNPLYGIGKFINRGERLAVKAKGRAIEGK